MVPSTLNNSPKVDSSHQPESPPDTHHDAFTNVNNNNETLTDSTPHSDLPEIPEETEPRTLFVGDLSFFCTEQHLHDLFQTYGSIESVQLKGSNDGKPHLSYGFIRFQQHEAANTAIDEMDGQLFLGRTIRVGWASDNPHRKAVDPKKRVPKSNSDATAQVHVSFTARDSRYPVTEATLRDQFSQYGELLDVTIKKTLFNKHTGMQTGYGFVHYALNQPGISSAYAAVQSTNQVAYGSVTYESSFSHSLRDYIASSSNQQPDRVKYSHPPASTPSPDLFFHSVPNMQSFPSNIMSYPVSHAPPPPPSMPAPSAASILSTQYPATATGSMGYLPTVMPNPSYFYPSSTSPNLMAGSLMTSAQNQSYPHNLMPPAQSPMPFPGMATATAYPVPPPTHLYSNQIYFEASPQPTSLPPLHLPPHINTSSPPFSTPRKSSPSTTSSSHSQCHQQNHHQTTPNYLAQQPYYNLQQSSPHYQYQQPPPHQPHQPHQQSPHYNNQQHQQPPHVSPTFHNTQYSHNNHNNHHNHSNSHIRNNNNKR